MTTLITENGRTFLAHPGVAPDTVEALALVADERIRQDTLWGQQDHTDLQWLAVATEELGEVAKAACEMCVPGQGGSTLQQLKAEIIQTAAVMVAWAEAIERRGR